MKRKWFRWIKVGLLLYCVAGIAFYYGQKALLFSPVAVAPSVHYDFGQPYKEITLPYDKETRLNVIEFTTSDSPRGVILYFHGKHQNVTRYASYAPAMTRKGYEVWMLDYPGFGKSTGVFSEQRLYDYALQFYKLARSRWQPSQIILYGKSLGTGIASQLADIRDCRRLILESPYYSLESVAGHYLPIYPWGRLLHYHFPTYEHLPKVTAPITIFQGSSDWVVPYRNASRLKPLLKAGDEFVTLEGGGHGDLSQYPLFRSKLDSVLMH